VEISDGGTRTDGLSLDVEINKRKRKVLYIFEYLVMVGLFYTVLTQLIVPIALGLPIFPWFRPISDLEDKVVEAREDVVEAELQVEATQLKEKAKTLFPLGSDDNVS